MTSQPARGVIGYTEAVTVELTRIVCGSCAGVYAIEERYRAQREAEAASWTCPYCKQGWGYSQQETATARAKRLAQELEDERRRSREVRAHKDAVIRVMRGHRTRLKRRIANGVCPCCQRSFENLARHMSGQHPTYVKQDLG